MFDQLYADWGKTDSPWDLNDDGIVDVRDFLRLLAKIAGGVNDAPTLPEETDTKPRPVPQDVTEAKAGPTGRDRVRQRGHVALR
jgi:hypothetical protein